jgi:hypothetical protein
MPGEPQLVSEIPLGAKAGEVAVDGPYAYVTSNSSVYPYSTDGTNSNLYIVDISNPAAGYVTGSIALESPNPNIAAYGGYVFAGELGAWSQGEYSGGGVRVVDARDPAAPRIAGFYDTPGFRDLAVEGQTLYVAGLLSCYNFIERRRPADLHSGEPALASAHRLSS